MSADIKEDLELATRRSLISDAYEKSSIAKEALDKEKQFRKATEKHIDNLLTNIKFQVESQQDARGLELKTLHTAVTKRLTACGKEWEAIIAGLEAYRKETDTAQHPSLTPTFNKMPDIIKSALKMIESFDNFALLCHGNVPKDYEYHTSDADHTRLGNEEGIWGNAKGSNLKMVLYAMLAELMNKKLAELVDIDTSPIVHVVDLPSGFTQSAHAKISSDLDFFSFADKLTLGVLVVDSGFEFGGHRFQKRYQDANGRLASKKYGPRDCSQFIEETTGSPIPTTTGDLHYTDADQRKTGKKSEGYLGWMQGKAPKVMRDIVKPYEITGDPDKDIQPGMVHCTNRFDSADCAGDPKGGHCTIVLGPLPGDRKTGAYNLLTFGYNRDRPTLEGFGQQDFTCSQDPIYSETTKKHVKSSLFTVIRKPGSK